jgi:hypothetical protein
MENEQQFLTELMADSKQEGEEDANVKKEIFFQRRGSQESEGAREVFRTVLPLRVS